MDIRSEDGSDGQEGASDATWQRRVAVETLEPLLLDSSDARSWAMFPHAMFRVAKFCKLYDSDADALMMVAHLKMAFVHPKPAARIMLLLENGQPVGHMLATLEGWFGTKFATIVQFECDRPVPREIALDALRFIEDWAKSEGCAFIQCMARNEVVARVFATYYGFEKQRVMMRKSLAESPSTEVADGAIEA